jgi:hypothetical protein
LWETTTVLENEHGCSFSTAVEGAGSGNKRGGIKPSPFVSKRVENKWGGVESSPLALDLLEKRWGWYLPTREVSKNRNEKDKIRRTKGARIDALVVSLPPCFLVFDGVVGNNFHPNEN